MLTWAITGVGSWLYTLSETIWMPRTLESQFAQFGSFGVALAFVTWFTGLSFVIVFAAVAAPSLAEGDDAFARWLRSGQPTALSATAKPALAGPSRPMRLSDAFGRGADGSGNAPVGESPKPMSIRPALRMPVAPPILGDAARRSIGNNSANRFPVASRPTPHSTRHTGFYSHSIESHGIEFTLH